MAICPQCGRDFPDAEFCPFDGTAIGSRTISTEALDDNYDYLIGTQLDGRYTVDTKVGEGGMGVVFLARHSVIEKPFAIKILKRSQHDAGQMARRFVQEAKAASRIRHPNVVDVTDFGTTPDGLSYQVMEFIEGQTLAATLRDEGVFATPRALTIAAQIARGLAAAHKMGVVHRDLKPENVFLVPRMGRSETVKIVDFGIAKMQPREDATVAPRLTQVGTIFGTPEYMAPEQASGRVDVDLRADVYSLGCVTFEMLTGRVPIQGSNTVKTVAMQILETIPTMASVNRHVSVSARLEAAVRKALAKRPQDRFRGMDEYLQALSDATSADELDLTSILSREMEAVHAQQRVDPRNATHQPSVDVENSDRLVTADWLDPPQADVFAQTPSWALLSDPRANRLETEPSNLQPPTGRPAWFWLLGGSFAIAATLVGLAYAFRGESVENKRPTHEAAPDATQAVSPIDAGEERVAATPIDASAITVALAVDASAPPSRHTNKPRRRHKSPPRKDDSPLGPPQEVRIFTLPAGARLYDKNGYQGTDQLTMVRPEGTRIDINCTLPGYKNGRISIRFDGKKTRYTCVLKREKICLDDLRNPYDKCKVAPEPSGS